MEFIMDNGVMIVVAIAVAVYIGIGVWAFATKPRPEQIASVKEWLLWAVNEAEEQLGRGTGPLKLRMCYDLFVTSFPWVARFISFETFSGWVDEALDEMEKMLKGGEGE